MELKNLYFFRKTLSKSKLKQIQCYPIAKGLKLVRMHESNLKSFNGKYFCLNSNFKAKNKK